MKFLRLFLVLPLILVLQFCKNDLDVVAPYKEYPSVYAVLNPQKDLQMIRVNKVFLGAGDANVMAKVSDSINYQPGELTITLERTLNGLQASAVDANPPEDIIIFRDSMIIANPGSFNTNQRVYVSNKKLFTTGVYKLTIKNNITGNVFTAKAKAIDKIFADLQPLIAPFWEYPPNTKPELYIDYSITNSKFPYDVRHKGDSAYGEIFQLMLRMHLYDSVSPLSQRVEQAVDLVVSTKTLRDVVKLSGISYITHSFTGNAIYTAVGNAVSRFNQNIMGRKMYMVEYFVYSSSTEYQDYMEYIKPSLSISQNKPLYSNFDNKTALGLFTFRTELSVKKNLSSVYINSFSNNPSTCSYKFYTSDLLFRGCK